MSGHVWSCLALPCLALPCLDFCLALPCLALVCLALPCLALSCLGLPCLALSCLALSCVALPCLALPCLGFSIITFRLHMLSHHCLWLIAASFSRCLYLCYGPCPRPAGFTEEKIYKKQIDKLAMFSRVIDDKQPENNFTEQEKKELLQFDYDDIMAAADLEEGA